jgi:hypothetical protein
MTFIPRDASDDQIFSVVHHWIDILAAEDYEAVFSALGYALAYQYDCTGPEAIRRAIKSYRSPALYPGIDEFKVTNWRTAIGGNLSPIKDIVRYKPNSTGLRGAVCFDLPLNGAWSDLQVNFVWGDGGLVTDVYPLGLEDIVSPAQLRRESEPHGEQG